jgi:flagellar capping protein FliD
MSGLSVAGIASGIDSDSIISQMVAFETRSISNLQTRIAFEESERLLFEDISSRLQDLKGATSVFSSDSLFASLSTTVSQPDLLSVTATDEAPRGTQRVRVMQLATSHRIGGTGVEDSSATPVLQGGFTKTAFGAAFADGGLGEALSTVTASDVKTESTTSGVPADDYDYLTGVKLAGQYTGAENVDIQVKLTRDATLDASGNGSIFYKVSLDGGQTFTSEKEMAVTGGAHTLTNLEGTGIDLRLEGLTGKTLKDDDLFQFRARGTAALEFTVGDGERKSIELTSDMTLDTLVRTINEEADLGLRADILNDGSSSDPFRLILTSLTEGRAGNITLMHNDSVIGLNGTSTEAPITDSLGYGGELSVTGDYDGRFGNSSVVIEMMEAGAVDGGVAKFRISTDGGLTFLDNNGDGFDVTSNIQLKDITDDDGVQVFGADSTLELDLTAGSFQVGDRVTMDLYDSEIETAQDALINVNGINLVKSSNVIDDVFEGLSLTLRNADPNKVISVGITEKAGDITAALGGFVDAYNSVMSVLHSQSKFNPDEDDAAPLLMGDSTVRQLQQSLQRYVTGRIGILGADTISSLADVGITTDSKTAQLSFNPTKLAQALNEDSNGVRRLLSRFGDVIEGSNASFVSSTNNTKAGKYEVEVTQARTRAEVISAGLATDIVEPEKLIIRVNKEANTAVGNVTSMVVNFDAGMTPQEQIKAIQDTFDSKELAITASLESGKIVIRHNEYGSSFKIDVESQISTPIGGVPADGTVNPSGFKQKTRISNQGQDLKGKINGVTVSSEGDQLVGKSGFAFDGIRIRVENDFVGEAGTIRLNDGLGSSFTNLLDSFIGGEGLLDTRIGSFDSAISRLQSQIDRVNERATLLEDRLRSKFTNLEVTLGRLNATGDFLTAQLKTLPGVSKKD